MNGNFPKWVDILITEILGRKSSYPRSLVKLENDLEDGSRTDLERY